MGIFGGSKGKKKEPVKGIPVSTPASSAPPPPLASGSGILRKPEPRSNEADRDALFSRSGSGVNKQAAKAPASQQHVRFGEQQAAPAKPSAAPAPKKRSSDTSDDSDISEMSLGDIPMGKGAGSDKSTSPETSEDERPPPAKKEPIRDSDRSRPSAQPAQPPRPAPAPEPKPDEPVPQPGFKRPAGASGFDYTSAPPAAPRPQYTAPSQPAPPRQAPAQAAPPPASSYAPPPPASQPPPLPMPPHLAQRPVSPRRSPTAAPPTAVEEEMLALEERMTETVAYAVEVLEEQLTATANRAELANAAAAAAAAESASLRAALKETEHRLLQAQLAQGSPPAGALAAAPYHPHSPRGSPDEATQQRLAAAEAAVRQLAHAQADAAAERDALRSRLASIADGTVDMKHEAEIAAGRAVSAAESAVLVERYTSEIAKLRAALASAQAEAARERGMLHTRLAAAAADSVRDRADLQGKLTMAEAEIMKLRTEATSEVSSLMDRVRDAEAAAARARADADERIGEVRRQETQRLAAANRAAEVRVEGVRQQMEREVAAAKALASKAEQDAAAAEARLRAAAEALARRAGSTEAAETERSMLQERLNASEAARASVAAEAASKLAALEARREAERAAEAAAREAVERRYRAAAEAAASAEAQRARAEEWAAGLEVERAQLAERLHNAERRAADAEADMAERMAMATASEREAKALRAQLAAASAAASAHTTPAGKGGAGAAGNAAGGADWGLMRGPTGDALARALQRGYLEADPAHNRPAVVGASAIVEEFMNRVGISAHQQASSVGGKPGAGGRSGGTEAALRIELEAERAGNEALRTQVAAQEAQLSTLQNRLPGHHKRQLREVKAQLEVLRSRNLQLREAVHLLRAAMRPSLSSAVACVNVLAAAQAAGGLGPQEMHGLAAGLQGLSSLAQGAPPPPPQPQQQQYPGMAQQTPLGGGYQPQAPPPFSPATPALNAGGYASAYGDPSGKLQQQQQQQPRPYPTPGGYAPQQQEDPYGVGGGYPGSGAMRYPQAGGAGGYGGGGYGVGGGAPPPGSGVSLYGGHYPGAHVAAAGSWGNGLSSAAATPHHQHGY